MDWNKILEGSGYKISEGQYHGKHGDGMIWTEPSISVDASTDFDDQDIAVAIVRSLEDYEADEDQKRKKVVGNESQLEEDEQLARALQESLNMESPPQHDAGNIFARTLQGSLNMESPPRHDAGNIFSRALQGSLNVESPPRHDAGNIFSRALQGSLNAESPPRHDAGNIFARALQGSLNMESPSRHDAGNIFDRALQWSLNIESPPRHDAGNIFSRPLQGSLNMESPPRRYAGNIFQPSTFFPPDFRTCAGCNCEIGHEKHLRRMDADWHPECCRCHACGLRIFDLEFSMSGNRPYHESCYKDQNHPRCNVCKNFIPTNADGETEYRKHPFWLQEYCPSHEDDGTPRCCSCERTEVRDTRYLSLDDGRKLCLECLNSAIMDTLECQPLYLEIQEFYEGLNMKVEQQIPLLLVERQALNEAREGEKSGHHLMPETRGLCLSEEQTVSTISRRPRIGTGHRFIDMMTEPCRLVRRCEVTAILILYGLPRLLTGTILAHEMMHAWLKLKGYPNLSQDVEEGICQVLAYMWLDSEIHSSSGNNVGSASTSSSSSTSQKGARSQFEKKLGEFFKHQIESDRSPAYGDGFRAGNQAVQKYGLKSTLDHIRLTRSFPY